MAKIAKAGDDCGNLTEAVVNDLLDTEPLKSGLSEDQKKEFRKHFPKGGQICLRADVEPHQCQEHGHEKERCCKLTNIHPEVVGTFDLSFEIATFNLTVKVTGLLSNVDQSKNGCPVFCEDGEVTATLIATVNGTVTFPPAGKLSFGKNISVKEKAKRVCSSKK